ncbi:MAG: hypothetical protein WCO56_29645 [Verrucomicrobiota bacterium]
MKKIIIALSLVVCAAALMAGEGKKKACGCCEATVDAGKACTKCECCKKAAEEGKVCAKCHPAKKEKKQN